MDNFIFLLILIVSITITSTLAAPNNRVGFGDPCSKTIKCKSQSWLVCNPKTLQCDCAKPDEMIYDSARGKCVGTIGERCKYGFAFDDETLGSFYEKMDCVDGAECEITDGICVCPTGTYVVEEENKCLPVKPIGAVCQSTNECSDTLICLNGKCDCATENMIFEPTSGTCRLKVGESCSLPILNCVNGSECILDMCRCIAGMYTSSDGLCMPQKGLNSNCNSDIECNNSQFLSCLNGECVCRTGFSLTSKGLCGLAYDEECSKINVCNDKFTCTQYDTGETIGGKRLQSTKCLCSNTELEFFDGNTCVGVVGGPCKPEIGCVKNAHCQNNVCECRDGYVENDLMNCDVAHGYACEPPSVDGDVIPCDRLSGLLCKQKPGESGFNCSCPNGDDFYYSHIRKCVRQRNFTCKLDTECMADGPYSCKYKHSTDPSGRCYTYNY